MKINRPMSLDRLNNRQMAITYESEMDEGAAEHYAEIQSVIDIILNNSSTDEQIINAANWVGLDSDLRTF